MKDQRIFKLFVVLFMSLIITSCGLNKSRTITKIVIPTKITEPKIDYNNYKITKATDKKVSVELSLIAKNPNKVALKNILVGVELFTQGKRFFVGNNIKLILKANDKTMIIVPVEVIYNDILKVAGDIAKKIVNGKTTIKVLAKLTVIGTPTLYNAQLFSFDYKTEKTFPVSLFLDIEDKDSKDKDSKDKDGKNKDEKGKDKDSKEKDGKDKDGKDKDGKEKDSKNKDGKEKDSKNKDGKDKDGKDKDGKDKDGKDKDGKDKDGKE